MVRYLFFNNKNKKSYIYFVFDGWDTTQPRLYILIHIL